MKCSRNSRLLRRPRPKQDESLVGYIIRLTENNYCPNINWILRMSGLKRRGIHANVFSPNTDDLSRLSLLSETEENILWSMAFPLVYPSDNPAFNTVKVFSNIVSTYALNKNFIQLCPICLQVEPYYRRIWDLSCLTACPIHQCLLINRCPQCHQPIIWSRPSILKCKCQYDWRDFRPQPVGFEQVTLSAYMYKLCQIRGDFSGISQNLSDSNPVGKLSLSQLITLLESLTKFFKIPIIRRGLLSYTASFYSSTVTSDRYYDRVFILLTDWPNNLLMFIKDYEFYLKKYYHSQYILHPTEVDMLDFFREILTCLTLNNYPFFTKVIEDYFWDSLRRMSLKNVQISFFKNSQFYSICGSLRKGKSFFEKLINKFDLKGLTLSRLLTDSKINIYDETIFFKMSYWSCLRFSSTDELLQSIQ